MRNFVMVNNNNTITMYENIIKIMSRIFRNKCLGLNYIEENHDCVSLNHKERVQRLRKKNNYRRHVCMFSKSLKWLCIRFFSYFDQDDFLIETLKIKINCSLVNVLEFRFFSSSLKFTQTHYTLYAAVHFYLPIYKSNNASR